MEAITKRVSSVLFSVPDSPSTTGGNASTDGACSTSSDLPTTPVPQRRVNSLATFDNDLKVPVSPRKVDPSTFFSDLNPDTPASEAIKAVSEIKPSRLSKFVRVPQKVRKRPRIKNLTRDVKMNRRRRRSHIKGKKIDGKHEQYALSMGMMLGIRVCVGNLDQGHKIKEGKLRMELRDFMEVEKYTFPPSGSLNTNGIHTPPHRLSHTFKFKAYAPRIFDKIRTMFGVEAGHFMLSVCGEFNFIEFISNAKSGQFFFYSHDGRYMIKTQTDAESRFLRRIMPHYYQYMVRNPHTTLTHFYGMYRVKMAHLRRNVHFVIMKSVFNTDKRIHRMWDLKGSTVGRVSGEEEGVKKDLNILNDGTKLRIGNKKKELFMAQLRSDVTFLSNLEIMDYSLLLGVHDREKAEENKRVFQEKVGKAFEEEKKRKENHASSGTVPEGLISGDPAVLRGRRFSTGEPALGLGDAFVSRSDTPMRRGRRQSLIDEGKGVSDEETCNNSDAKGSKHAVDDPVSRVSGKETSNGVNSTNNGDDFKLEMTTSSTDESIAWDSDESEYDSGVEDLDSIDEESIVSSLQISANLPLPQGGMKAGQESTNTLASLSSLRSNATSGTAHDTLKRHSNDLMVIKSLVDGVHQMPNPLTRRKDLGIESVTKLGEIEKKDANDKSAADGAFDAFGEKIPCQEIYFCGIIDILQQYNVRKQSETLFKGFVHNRKEISCVDPKWYAERFLMFIEKLLE